MSARSGFTDNSERIDSLVFKSEDTDLRSSFSVVDVKNMIREETEAADKEQSMAFDK